MDELAKAVDIAVKGPVAEKALAVLRRQMRQWGITMPPVEALVLDFGLGRFEEIGEIEHWIANETAEGYCGKFLFVQDGQTCPTHYHKNKHETFFVVKGAVRMSVDEIERTMSEGDVLVVEQCKPHGFTGMGPALLLEVSRPSVLGDNYFDNPEIKIGHADRPPRHLAAHGSEPIRGASRQEHAASRAQTRAQPPGDVT